MASSEDDNNNNNNNDSGMGFHFRGEMSSGSMFNNKSSSGSGNLFGSGWDPLENFGGSSSMVAVPHNNSELGGENHQGGLIHHYQSGSGIGDLVPKIGSFGSGSFSEMVNPFANLNPESSSPNSRDKRKALHPQFNPPITNGKREERNDGSGDTSDEKKQRIEANWRGKQMGKQAKENSDSGGYIHVRAKRGQATNSHSLAERVRRERISERMKLLQELVPGCNKITGKAVMLDEIINYVQSLQQQVEFLSMKLATVNPELNIDIDRLVFKDILQHSRGSNSNPGFGYSPALSSSHSYPHGSLPGIPTTTVPLHPIHPQPVWDNDLHNLLQMGFDANLGQNGGGGAKMDV